MTPQEQAEEERALRALAAGSTDPARVEAPEDGAWDYPDPKGVGEEDPVAPLAPGVASFRDVVAPADAAGPEHLEASTPPPQVDYEKHLGGNRVGRAFHKAANVLTLGMAGWGDRVAGAEKSAEAERDYLQEMAKSKDKSRQIGQQLGDQLGYSGDTSMEEAQMGTQLGRNKILDMFTKGSMQAQRLGHKDLGREDEQAFEASQSALERAAKTQRSRIAAKAKQTGDRGMMAVVSHPMFERAWADIASGRGDTEAVQEVTRAGAAAGIKPADMRNVFFGASDRGNDIAGTDRGAVTNTRKARQETAGATASLGKLRSTMDRLGQSEVDVALSEISGPEGVLGTNDPVAKELWNDLRNAVAARAFALGGKALTQVEKTMTLGQLADVISTSVAEAGMEESGFLKMAFGGFLSAASRGSITQRDIQRFLEDSESAVQAAQEAQYGGAQLGAVQSAGIGPAEVSRQARMKLSDGITSGALPYAKEDIDPRSVQPDVSNPNMIQFKTRDGQTHVFDPSGGREF